MLDLLAEHVLEIAFGLVASVTSILAVHYARSGPVKANSDVVLGPPRSVSVFLNRDSMVESLLTMYDRARPGDVVWAQTVGMRNYPGPVAEKVLSAAARGVEMRYLANAESPEIEAFEELFTPVESAVVLRAHNNDLRIQGLGHSEVIIAFPTMRTYTAVRFTDPAFVRMVKSAFDQKYADVEKSQTQEAKPYRDLP